MKVRKRLLRGLALGSAMIAAIVAFAGTAGVSAPATAYAQAEEPFVAQRSMPVSLTPGWSTFSVAVQYRDAAGNLSMVYCDSIGVEGMPRRP
jgi:hypothetical protein